MIMLAAIVGTITATAIVAAMFLAILTGHSSGDTEREEP